MRNEVDYRWQSVRPERLCSTLVFLELIPTGIVALLVLGPERLPQAAITAGRWIGQANRMMTNFSETLDREIQEKAFDEN